MAIDLLELPEEVLLHLLRFVPIKDALSLCEVCTIFAALARTHTYWLSSLTYTDAHARLACSYGTDLAALAWPRLKAIAAHTLRRERNWDRAVLVNTHGSGYPLSGGTNVGPHETLLFVVPGTPLVVTHSRADGRLCCWDSVYGALVGTLEAARVVDDVAAGVEERGRFTVVLLVQTPLPALLVISVEHTEHMREGTELAQVTMTERFRWDSLPNYVHRAPFICEDVVGVLRAEHIPDASVNAEIVAVNMTSDAAAVVQTLFFIEDGGHLNTVTSDSGVHVIDVAGAYAVVHHCPRAHLPHTGLAPTPDGTTDCTPGVALGTDPLGTASVRCPGAAPSAAAAVTAHAHPAGLAVRFWPLVGGRPAFAAGAAAALPGAFHPARPVVVASHAGRSVLAVVQDAGQAALRLVRDRGAEGVSVHRLETPEEVEWGRMAGACIDDCRGAAYFLEEGGFLHFVSYA